MARGIEGRLVVATHNAGKVRELSELLAPYGVEAVSAAELGLPVPPETGFMFSQNAAQKAHAAARASGLPALADDAGLCVDVLDGAPGLHTAEWAGEPRDYARAMDMIRSEVARRAGTSTAPGPTSPARSWWRGPTVTRSCSRDAATAPLPGLPGPPREGLRLDPMFVPDGHALTFAEMGAEDKHGGGEPLSHRARAFAAFAEGCLEPLPAPAP